jgi:hypothetical protein
MPTVQCECGEPIHYSADKVGLKARCRCGSEVRLPEPKRERRRKRRRRPLTQEALFEEEQRALNVRRQILAVLFAAVVLTVLVYLGIRASSSDLPDLPVPAAEPGSGNP